MHPGHLGQDDGASVGRDLVELLLMTSEGTQRFERIGIAGLADVGEREPGLERDLEIFIRRVLEQALLGIFVAEASECRGVPGLERRGSILLELGQQGHRWLGANLTERIGRVTASFRVGIFFREFGEGWHRRLIFDLAEGIGTLHAHGGFGFFDRSAQRGLRIFANLIVIDRLFHRRWRNWCRLRRFALGGLRRRRRTLLHVQHAADDGCG